MSYLKFIKRATLDPSTRWIIKYDSKGIIKEIKQLFNPEEYKKRNIHNRDILNKEELIEQIEKNNEKNNTNSRSNN